ncbi:hypothetical protein VTK73DRAFT_764 [Phialemonium thermophilum]|uniref:Histone H4 n=1 Tax=Phialemonium thermophilum TaxID=223376 RepID=A0ABR3XCW1_9PEZI
MPPTITKRGGIKPRPGALGGKSLPKRRHRKITKDALRGITKPDIRRLARRGGVKRISVEIYSVIRETMVQHIGTILQRCVLFTEHRQAKTVTVHDVIFALKRMGRPIYGFDPETYELSKAAHKRRSHP